MPTSAQQDQRPSSVHHASGLLGGGRSRVRGAESAVGPVLGSDPQWLTSWSFPSKSMATVESAHYSRSSEVMDVQQVDGEVAALVRGCGMQLAG